MDDTPSYLAEVEAVFTQARGRGLMLAESDIALVDSWESRGISVHLICRALTEGIQQWRDRHGDRRAPPHRLAHYKDFIETALLEHRDGLVHNHEADVAKIEGAPPTAPAKETDPHRGLSLLLLARAERSQDARIGAAWTLANSLLNDEYKHVPSEIAREQLFDVVCDEVSRKLTPKEQSVLDAAVESRLLPERLQLGPSGIAIRRQAMLREEVALLFRLKELNDEQ